MNDRQAFDLDSYVEHIQKNPYFICEMIAGRLEGNHVLYQNDDFMAFLNKYPTLYGYILVAPIVHKEQVTGDFTLEAYLTLRRAVAPERVYILSLGSQQGNSHVHWHIVPLPSNIPLKKQQLAEHICQNMVFSSSL